MPQRYLVNTIENVEWKKAIVDLCKKHKINIYHTTDTSHFDDDTDDIRLNGKELRVEARELNTDLGTIVAFTIAHEIGHFFDCHDLLTPEVTAADQLYYLGSVRNLSPLLECEIRAWKIGRELLKLDGETFLRYAAGCVHSHANNSPYEYEFQVAKRLKKEQWKSKTDLS
jgi:hypothetical protein